MKKLLTILLFFASLHGFAQSYQKQINTLSTTKLNVSSYNSFTSAYATTITNMNTTIGGKLNTTDTTVFQRKRTGLDLSQNSYTTTEKNRVATIPTNVSDLPNDINYQTDYQVANSISASGGNVNAAKYAGVGWAALGTSITNYGTYSNVLATLSGMVQTNLGVSGATLSGTHGIYNKIASIPTSTSVVTLEAGINDFINEVALGTMGDTTLSTFYGALWASAKAIIQPYPSRALYFFTPYGNSDYLKTGRYNHANANGVYLWQYVKAVKDVGSALGIPVIDVGSEAGISGLNGTIMTADGIHLSTLGGKRYADYVWTKMKGYAISVTTDLVTVVATPQFSPAAATYTGTQSVNISSATGGANIYYTTDGSTPTTNSSVYSTPISVSSTQTISALATKFGLTQSAPNSATYIITSGVVAPTFSPVAGSYTTTQSVNINTSTSGAIILYTLDGSTPTPSSLTFTTPISVSANTTIKAYATKSALADSPTSTASYTVTQTTSTPTFSPASGSYTSTQAVTIASATSGATIYYTVDGTTPTTSSSVYSGSIVVSSSTTIKALATKGGYTNSTIGSATYSISSGVYSLSAIRLSDLSGTGLTPTTVNSDSTFSYTNVSGYSYKSLWLASNGNNAIEFQVNDVRGLGLAITLGEGASGWCGVIMNGSTNTAFTSLFRFVAANGAQTNSGTPTPTGVIMAAAPVVGDKFRVRRVGTFVTIEKLVSGSYTIVLQIDLTQQTGLPAAYYTNIKLGLLVSGGSYETAKFGKTGTY